MSETHHRVRWKEGRHRDARWRYGYVTTAPTVEPDGSVRVYAESHGGARSLDPRRVYYQGNGPRGGRRWLPINDLIHDCAETETTPATIRVGVEENPDALARPIRPPTTEGLGL